MRWIGATILAACAGLALPAQDVGSPDAELSCRVCHPGAVKGLQRSPHAILSQREDLRGRVCGSCHGDLAVHARAAGAGLEDRPPVPRVEASSCASCHPGQDLPPSRGRHLLAVIGSGAEPPAPPDAERVAALERRAADPTIDWSGFAELGYRFVHHSGSRDAYRTDLDLEPTVVLRDFEVRGAGSDAAVVDDVALRGRDIGDPRWDVDLSLGKAERFDFDSRFRRARYLYDAAGDYHRVDRDSRDWTSTFRAGARALEVFGSFTAAEQDGFWLTQRIGNRNLPVQTFVDGVASPRRARTREGELGVTGDLGPLRVTAAAGFTETRSTDRWSYSQPAAANPGFTESEDLETSSRLDGPTGRLMVSHDGGPLDVTLTGHVRDLERTVATAGTGAGFDTAAFTTATAGAGSGRGRLLLGELEAAFECTATLRVRLGARYRDYEERLRLRLVDVRTVPSPSSIVTTMTSLDDATVQRLFDGEVAVEWSPTDDLDLGIGYGFAREQLRVSSPGAADPGDFRSGEIDDDGLLADLRWRFAEDWTIRAEGRDFATDGVRLHELTPQRSRLAKATLSWQREAGHAALFAHHRHVDNDVSDHRLDTFATGLSGSATMDSVELSAAYTFADIESRTRTNFYFDPDPDPQPTIVGFRGETHTFSALLTVNPHAELRTEFGAAVTRTIGSFDVDTADFHAGLLWRCTASGAAGLEWRHVRYDDQNGVDEWAADLVFVYWRQEW